MHHVTRGYFGLQDNDHIVHVTSDKDFVLYISGRAMWRHSMVEFSRRANSAVLVLWVPTMVSRRPRRIWAASARVRARSSTSPAHSGSRDDLSHGCHIRSEQCHHDAHVGPLLQR